MKKLVMALCAVLFSATCAFSQVTSGNTFVEDDLQYEDTSTYHRVIEDKYAELHPTAPNVRIVMDYTPLTGEVRFYYSCLSAVFKQGEAMKTAMAIF